MGLYQMTLTIAEIERISKEIRDYYRAESVNLSIQKIKMSFYDEIEEALESLNEMANESIAKDRIETYRKVMDKKEIMEKNLKNFLLKRYEKLMRESLYDISSKTYEPLAQPEKKFIMEMHNQMDALFRNILSPMSKGEEKQLKNEESTIVQDKAAKKEEIEEKQETQPIKSEMMVLSVMADYLPVATYIGDFYLHHADIVYLPKEIGQILLERKYAREIKNLS